jgi:hypothetical protein
VRGPQTVSSDEVEASSRLFGRFGVRTVPPGIVGPPQTVAFGLACATRALTGKPPYVRLRLALPVGPWRDLTTE